ncbi:hypothetical protein SynMVIR181_01357 [Synechococcus sp. MVIR-18-1]|nr:hypothetical protein SynMVIR181_01357 [Synechococcus sp. MVIR-18-1]
MAFSSEEVRQIASSRASPFVAVKSTTFRKTSESETAHECGGAYRC